MNDPNFASGPIPEAGTRDPRRVDIGITLAVVGFVIYFETLLLVLAGPVNSMRIAQLLGGSMPAITEIYRSLMVPGFLVAGLAVAGMFWMALSRGVKPRSGPVVSGFVLVLLWHALSTAAQGAAYMSLFQGIEK